MKYYIGYKDGRGELFKSDTTPTNTSHGHLYNAVVGAFRTKRGALYMLEHGHNNPHCQTVAQAERLALISKGQSELCAAYDKFLMGEIQRGQK